MSKFSIPWEHGVVVRAFDLNWDGIRFESISTHHCCALSKSFIQILVVMSMTKNGCYLDNHEYAEKFSFVFLIFWEKSSIQLPFIDITSTVIVITITVEVISLNGMWMEDFSLFDSFSRNATVKIWKSFRSKLNSNCLASTCIPKFSPYFWMFVQTKESE